MINMETIVRMIYNLPEINEDLLEVIKKKRGAKGRGKRKDYSDLFVLKALTLYQKVKSYGEVETQHGVSRNTVRLWASEYLGVVL